MIQCAQPRNMFLQRNCCTSSFRGSDRWPWLVGTAGEHALRQHSAKKRHVLSAAVVEPKAAALALAASLLHPRRSPAEGEAVAAWGKGCWFGCRYQQHARGVLDKHRSHGTLNSTLWVPPHHSASSSAAAAQVSVSPPTLLLRLVYVS